MIHRKNALMRKQVYSFILISSFFILGCSTDDNLNTTLPENVGRVSNEYQEGIDKRVQLLLNHADKNLSHIDKIARSDPDAGKRAWPKLLAALGDCHDDQGCIKNIIDTAAEKVLSSKWAGSFCKPFSLPGMSMFYFKYLSYLTEDQKNRLKNKLYTSCNCLGKDTLGWSYLQRVDGRMDPIYGGTEFNSENFNWMARMGGLLFAHHFNDSTYKAYYDSYLDNWIRTLFHKGRLEWNSNIYWGHCFNPLLSLYENAPNKKIKLQAKAGLDWMMTEAALHHIDGFHVAGDVRAKYMSFKPYTGSIWHWDKS